MSNDKTDSAKYDPRSGLVSMRSTQSVRDTVAALERFIASKGIRLFATIDHAAEARAVGLNMPPTVVLIVGDPRAGTPMMLVAPTIAIDLPLKLLIAEEPDGTVWISHVAAERLESRHGLDAAHARPLVALGELVTQFVAGAA